MSKAHVVVNLIDADGCLYNNLYFNLRIWLFVAFREELLELAHQAEISKLPLSQVPEFAIKVRQLKLELQSLNTKIFDDQNYVSDLYARFHKKSKELVMMKEENSDEMLNFEECVVNHLLNTIDPGLMREVFKKSNINLINELRSQDLLFATQLFGTGSYRQSFSHDRTGMLANNTGSHFEDLYFLVRSFRSDLKTDCGQATLLPLTMTDIQANLPRGTSYRRVMTKYHGQHAVYICDVSKLATIYAMAHDAACLHPHTKITINHFDDNEEIINNLADTFLKYPALLPKSVTVNFRKYNGELGLCRTVKGSAETPDENYYENVRLLISMAKAKFEKETGSVNVIKDVDLEKFLTLRKITKSPEAETVTPHLDDCDLSLVDDFNRLIDESASSTPRRVSGLFSISPTSRHSQRISEKPTPQLS
jgi:hypothetical protein